MLVPFAFSPGCIQADGPADPSSIDRINTLERLWRLGGILVVDSERKVIRAYQERIGHELSGQVRSRWLMMLERMHRSRSIDVENWELPACHSDEGSAGLAPAESLVISRTERDAWGGPAGEVCWRIHPEYEVCLCEFLNSSRMAESVEMNGSRHFLVGTPVKTVYEAFQVLFRFCLSVVIVDPFAGKDAVVHGGRSGAERFLEELATVRERLGRPLDKLTVYTADDVNRSVSSDELIVREEIIVAWQRRREQIPKSAIREIELCLGSYPAFRRQHDRFLRFNDFAMMIGAGMDVFRVNDRLAKVINLTRVEVGNARAVEGELRQSRGFSSVVLD